jgi:hypothetical protein
LNYSTCMLIALGRRFIFQTFHLDFILLVYYSNL